MANLIIKEKKDVPLTSLSKLRAEEESRKRAVEESEELEAVGQKSDLKALKWVKSVVAREEKLAKNQKELDLALLERFKRHKIHYLRQLAEIFLRFTLEENIPKKYQVIVDLSDKGLAVGIKGTSYIRAFTPCGLVSYDRHACKILAVQLGNTVAKLEGYYRTSDGGIILPDQEDRKLYG